MTASDGPPRELRPLLPRLAPAGAAPGPDLTAPVKLAPRRPPVKNACERCRLRKIKCEGTRPACATCIRLAFPCVYLSLTPDESRSTAIKRKFDEAQDRVSSHEEFYTLLKTRGAAEVAEMLRRIRAGMDVDSILRHARDGDLVLQLHLTPETRMRYTFPEFASSPTLFRETDDPYLEAPLLDFEPKLTKPPPERGPPDIHAYQMPYHAANMVDLRLSSVRAAMWTSVTTDDALVAKLLGIYFQHEYPRTPPFQKDLFLDDLVQGKTTFCSPLLVNAILANAAHGLASDPRRVEFWTPRSLPYAFLAEAKRLWELEIADGPKLTIIHAAMPLSMRYSADGADKIGLPFVMTALEMAEKMGLFTKREKGNSRMSFGRTFTAWALFTWQSMMLYYKLKPPFLVTPPVTPLPDQASFTGEICLQYPLQAKLTPTHLDAMFRSQIDLSIIMLEINKAATRAGAPGTAPPTLGQALELHGRLETWYKSLPAELQPDRVVMPQQLQLHMEYHLIIINLFDPWLSGNNQTGAADGATQADTPTPGGLSIREIGSRARARLETLIRLYYLRHSFDATDVLLILFLLMLGSISVRVLDSSTPSSTTIDATTNPNPPTIKDPTATRKEGDASTFLLCAKGLHDQGRNHYIGALMFELLAGLVRPGNEVLKGGLARVRAEFEGIPVKEEYVHMEWPVERWISGGTRREEGRVVEDWGSGDEEEV